MNEDRTPTHSRYTVFELSWSRRHKTEAAASSAALSLTSTRFDEDSVLAFVERFRRRDASALLNLRGLLTAQWMWHIVAAVLSGDAR